MTYAGTGDELVMKKILGLVALLFAGAGDLRAEFICKAEISYKWTQSVGPKRVVAEDEDTSGDGAVSDEAPEHSVFWSLIERRAATEDEAKARAADAAATQKPGAEKACRDLRENLAGCIAGKYASMSSTMQSLGFSARKAMEEAISQDCKKMQGRCLGADIPEIKCAPAASRDAAKADEGKDKGKKK